MFPYPRDRDYDQVADVKPEVEELLADSATAYKVTERLRKPLSYSQQRMQYKLCRDSEVGLFFLTFHTAGSYVGPTREQCYKLTLDFDQQEKLMRYDIVDWPEEIEEHADSEDLLERAKFSDAEAQWQLYAGAGAIDRNIEWLCAAADQGQADARRRVAILHRKGWSARGKNTVKAHVWYLLSAASGNQLSEEDAKQVWQEFTVTQRKQASFLSSHWKPGLCQSDLVRPERGHHQQSLDAAFKSFRREKSAEALGIICRIFTDKGSMYYARKCIRKLRRSFPLATTVVHEVLEEFREKSW